MYMKTSAIHEYVQMIDIYYSLLYTFNSFSNDQILDWSKLKTLADGKINVT